MNKKYIPGVIIVEGKHDVSKLSLIYESIYVITNGYEIPHKEINFLKALNKDTQVIILTDNDKAGDEIRIRLNDVIPNAINTKINAPKDSKKQGIAECEIDDIQKTLDKYVSDTKTTNQIDLYKLGLIGKENSKELRELVSNKFNLGIENKNNMIARLNLLGIKEEQIKEVIICNK